MNKYYDALKHGFDYYGLNGFYEMHKDVCDNPDNPWGYDLEVLNELSYEDFEKVAIEYLKSTK